MAVNVDLQKERNSATFDTEKLTEILYNGRAAVKRRRYLQKIVLEDKYLKSFPPWTGAANEASPLGLHDDMFIPTIEKLGTKDQIAKYVEPAKQYKIIGTYAQTELGHGTFIRGLETTATYDPKTGEFIVNSPTTSSIKYWPGSWISVGDIGSKIGYSSIDNGYLKLDNVRIPRESLLARYSRVEKDGSYVPSNNPRLAYGTMVYVRAFIVGGCSISLSQACVISTRYSAVRRQTEMRPGVEEPQVIDYQTQQEKIFPLLAAAYAMFFTGDVMMKEYYRINADMEKGMLDEMAALHALAAGLKAYSAEVTSNGVDKLRMACGGHGYTHASGIPKIWSFITPACTYEGENTVMYLQCARYLVKQYAQAAIGQKLVGFMSYLNNPVKPRSALNDDINMSDLIEAYEHATARFSVVEHVTVTMSPPQWRPHARPEKIVLEDKYLKSFPPWWNCNRNEHYDIGVKKHVYMTKLIKDLNITDTAEQSLIFKTGAGHEANPFGVQYDVFIPTIEKLGTKDQIAKYLEPAKQYKIIGTYAQTELGHGTFIRGLETTATYDPKTEEFIVNSPTISSIKYWPGSWISVGDIGSKIGCNSNDNGYLKLDNVRIPRESLLARYSRVEKDGTYVPSNNPRLVYGAMVFARAFVVGGCSISLSQACVISTRYSAVRRQSEMRPGGEEPQVIDYQTQQEKIFPLLAAAYAMFFTGDVMMSEYYRINADMEKGMLDEMAALHALAAGLKAYSAEVTSNGVDKLRMACGGHGYTHASGIPKIWSFITPACTYEGENTVMYLQCARYLVKQYAQAATGQKLVGFMSYLNNPVKQRSALNDDLNMSDLIEAYEHAAARLIKVVATRMQSLMKDGMSIEEARNKCGVPMVAAAKAHCQTYVVKLFSSVVNRPEIDPSVTRVLQTLCKLYAVYGINQRLGEFIQDGFLSGQQADMILNKTLSLFAEIRPNAVALVDVFDYPDQVLQSCIGRYDGNVYEALYEYAKTSPLNKTEVHDSYYTTLKPLMEGKLKFDTPPARL